MKKQRTIEEAIDALEADELVAIACRMLGDMRDLESTEMKLAVSGTVNMLLLKAWQKEKARQALEQWDRMDSRGTDVEERFRARAAKETRGGGRRPEWPRNSVTGPKGLTHNPFENALGKLKEKTG